MGSAIIEALTFAVRVLWYMVTHIYAGYAQAIGWFNARARGEYYPFPFGSFLWSIILTLVLIWFLAQ